MNPNRHTLKSRHSLDRALTALRDNVLRLMTLVDEALAQSIKALRQQDVELAQQIINDDQRINVLRYRVEEDAYSLIARHQPTARDLRCTVAAIHLATELERIGDYAANIAKLALELSTDPWLKSLIDIPRMADICQHMLYASLDAYVKWDVDLAWKTIERDNEIDALGLQVYHELLGLMIQESANINRSTKLLWIAYNLERIGDRITNICERVIYMVTGDINDSEITRAQEGLD